MSTGCARILYLVAPLGGFVALLTDRVFMRMCAGVQAACSSQGRVAPGRGSLADLIVGRSAILRNLSRCYRSLNWAVARSHRSLASWAV